MVRPDDDPQWYLPDNGKVGQAKPDNGNTKTEPDNGPHKNHNGGYFIENPRPDNGSLTTARWDNQSLTTARQKQSLTTARISNATMETSANNVCLTTAM